MWEKRERMLDEFWMRWKKEYLNELRFQSKTRNGSADRIKPGTVVLLEDPNKPRLLWSLARIEQVHPGRDQKVRSCTIRLPSELVTRRPVQRLYPLEAD